MQKFVKLKKDNNMLFNSTISEYINPDFVYVPVKKNYNILLKQNDTLFKEQIILENNLNKIISPVSGFLVDAESLYADGKKVPCLKIKNDFQEKNKLKTAKKGVTKNRESIVSKLYEYYFKYIASILETKKINNLIISGVEDEPYINNNSYIINKYNKEILEITDLISSTFDIDKSFIVLKSNDTKNIEKFISKIGTYPNISLSLIEDSYLLAKPFFLMQHFGFNEVDSCVIEAKEVLNIYNAIKYNQNVTETYITISGNAIKKSKVLRVKIGTLLKDVIDKNIELTTDKVDFVLNGLMSGYKCNPENTIITQNTIGCNIMKEESLKQLPCNNCGLCYKICPVKINPKKALDNKIASKNCLDCGLCSYICPCHINLRSYLRGEHE